MDINEKGATLLGISVSGTLAYIASVDVITGVYQALFVFVMAAFGGLVLFIAVAISEMSSRIRIRMTLDVDNPTDESESADESTDLKKQDDGSMNHH